jgi:hypothetical protein
MSLGWRLAIFTGLIISVVMGGVTVFQRQHEIRMERHAREALLKESLAPLVYRLTGIESEEALREEFMAFCHAFVQAGYPAHQMELRGADGKVVMSTLSQSATERDELFEVSVPIVSPAVNTHQGTLILWEDASEYNAAVSRQWRSWSLHMVLTLLPTLLFVTLAIRFVVTRPLERLLDRVRKMEMGYWEQMPFDEGPWEIRWLGLRFRNLGIELKKTVEELMKAERRASSCSRSMKGLPEGQSPRIENAVASGSMDVEHKTSHEQLWQEYQRLTSMSAHDPETLELAKRIWASDAKKAGLEGEMTLKAALEDESLRILQPGVFLELEDSLADLKVSLADWVKQREADLLRVLNQERIPYVSVSHRVKHVAGIWRKMNSKGLTLDEVDDIYAFRIVVPTESDCYWTLGVIHYTFQPVVGRFNDYIAKPKSNGYQSIHTCVRTATGPVFEIQIRSVTMHRNAERGSAAHWLYKEEQFVSIPDRPGPLSRLRRLLGR